jgi:hypothetical protein
MEWIALHTSCILKGLYFEGFKIQLQIIKLGKIANSWNSRNCVPASVERTALFWFSEVVPFSGTFAPSGWRKRRVVKRSRRRKRERP